MINKTTKQVVKEVTEVVDETFVCDVCKHEGQYKKYLRDSEKTVYYHITTGHHDWGNDSCDSIVHKDACCVECLLKVMSDWLNDPDNKSSNTAYINIGKQVHSREIKKNDK
jgi:hypothetical protein